MLVGDHLSPAQQVELAETILARAGLMMVRPEIAATIARLESEPASVSEADRQAVLYWIASGPFGQPLPRRRSQAAPAIAARKRRAARR
jgi:hypothetical protein